MNDSITIEHGLPYFCVTSEPRKEIGDAGKELYVTEGKATNGFTAICDICGGNVYAHGTYERKIRDIELMGKLSVIVVRGIRTRCQCCHTVRRVSIPFADQEHNITLRLRRRIQARLNNGMSITECSKMFSIHPNTIYRIDKDYLVSMYKRKKPRQARYIGIDEFLLHNGHRYATVVVDLERGHVLFAEEGKRKQQAYDFFEYVGDEWMRQVVAVSMDMNAQYDSAFREMYPNIKVVYDFFHMVKMYNDTVITAMRRRIQKELLENGDEDGYALMKGSRFILLSSMETLERKDRAAIANNARLISDYRNKGLPLPPGERMMRTTTRWKLKTILRKNEGLSTAYFLLEQFKLAYRIRNREALADGISAWLKLAYQSGCPEIEGFADAISRRLDGILSHADHQINSGAVEGINNMIKTVRRKAYGFRDTEYFFLKIIHESRRPRYIYKSNRLL